MFSFGKKKEEKPPVRVVDMQNMQQVEKLWKEWLHCFSEAAQVKKEVELEKQAFSDAVIKIKNIIQGPEENGNLPYNKIIHPIPDIKLLMKKFIAFLEQSVYDKANKQTTITLLTILRKIIEKEDDELKKQAIQNQFDKLGAMKMVLKVLAMRPGAKRLAFRCASLFIYIIGLLLMLPPCASLFIYFLGC